MNITSSFTSNIFVEPLYGNKLLCFLYPSKPMIATPSIKKVGIPYLMVWVAVGNSAEIRLQRSVNTIFCWESKLFKCFLMIGLITLSPLFPCRFQSLCKHFKGLSPRNPILHINHKEGNTSCSKF